MGDAERRSKRLTGKRHVREFLPGEVLGRRITLSKEESFFFNFLEKGMRVAEDEG